MEGRGGRFWTIYAGAWATVGLIYTGIFAVGGLALASGAPLAALANVVPAALLGVAVVRVTDVISWPPRSWPRFLAAHVALAVAYAAFWYVGVGLAFGVQSLVLEGEWSLGFLFGPAVPWVLFQGLALYACMAALSYTARAFERLRTEEVRTAHAESRAVRAEALRTAAELHALRTRLDPHFLFNTLHTLNALVRRDGEAASMAIERFASLLRFTLDIHGDDDVPLRKECGFIRDYLALEKLRLGDRLEVTMGVPDDALDVPLPAFTLQPLVENAVRHGVAARARGGRIALRAAVRGDRLHVEIRDDGPGGDPEALGGTGGLGLELVRGRLEARYGGTASLEIATAPGAGFTATVEVPVDPAAPVSRSGTPDAPGRVEAVVAGP